MTDVERMEAEMAGELVGRVRDTAKAVTGGNCTFADSDVKMLGRLARRAIEAGLIDGFDRPTTRNLERKREEFLRDSVSDAKHEDPRSGAEPAGAQSGGSEASASPKSHHPENRYD